MAEIRKQIEQVQTSIKTRQAKLDELKSKNSKGDMNWPTPVVSSAGPKTFSQMSLIVLALLFFYLGYYLAAPAAVVTEA